MYKEKVKDFRDVVIYVLLLIVCCTYSVLFFNSVAESKENEIIAKNRQLLNSQELKVAETMETLLETDVEILEYNFDEEVFTVKAEQELYQVRYSQKEELIEFSVNKTEIRTE